MEAAGRPEELNQEGFAEMNGRRDDAGPVVMLNLLAFRPDGGAERYMEYGAAVAPLLEKAGGRVVYSGQASPALIGEGSWDMVLLVEYPSRRAFIEMVGSPEYLEIANLRTEALLRGELHPLDTTELDPAPSGGGSGQGDA